VDAAKVKEAAAASLAGTKPFPAIVADLVAAGVEYYHVDYAAKTFRFYGAGGASVPVPLDVAELPPISADFDGDALRAAILDSQRNGQKFPEFCRRAVKAGVQGYFAFLRGKRVTYLGRQGESHVEWFPGAKP
jgi:uncharacterized protein YbcV (DUF1398 family)